MYTAAAEHEERQYMLESAHTVVSSSDEGTLTPTCPRLSSDLPPSPTSAKSLPFDRDLSFITPRAQHGLNEAFRADLPFVAAAVKARDQGVLENRALNMGRAMAESLARLGAFPNWRTPRRLAPSPSQA